MRLTVYIFYVLPFFFIMFSFFCGRYVLQVKLEATSRCSSRIVQGEVNAWPELQLSTC